MMYDHVKNRTMSQYCSAIFLAGVLFWTQAAHALDLNTTDDFPYALIPATELALAPAGVILLTVGGILETTAEPPTRTDVLALDKNDIPAWDRSAIYHYSSAANTTSDIGLITMQIAPTLLALSQLPRIRTRWRNLLTLAAMYSEAAMLTLGATQITKILANRPRPFLYNDSAPMTAKTESPYKSFFSGHTSTSFCSAVFISTVFADLYPRSPWRFVVIGTSLSIASVTGMMRYFAGKHFPSDILVGAAVGSLFGYVVPYLHRKRVWHENEVDVAILPDISSRFAGLHVVLGL